MEEQVMNVGEAIINNEGAKSFMTKENGVKALAVVGAATIVYGGYKLVRMGINKFSSKKEEKEEKVETKTKTKSKVKEEVKEEVKEDVKEAEVC